jgi:hypothetical protein
VPEAGGSAAKAADIASGRLARAAREFLNVVFMMPPYVKCEVK